MAKKNANAGSKEGLGFGIIGLGLLLLFLPSAAQQIANLNFVSGSALRILLTAVYVLSVFIILAGIAVVVARFKDDTEDEE